MTEAPNPVEMLVALRDLALTEKDRRHPDGRHDEWTAGHAEAMDYFAGHLSSALEDLGVETAELPPPPRRHLSAVESQDTKPAASVDEDGPPDNCPARHVIPAGREFAGRLLRCHRYPDHAGVHIDLEFDEAHPDQGSWPNGDSAPDDVVVVQPGNAGLEAIADSIREAPAGGGSGGGSATVRPRMATSCTIDRHVISVDGRPFPWLISDRPIKVTYEIGQPTLVELTLQVDGPVSGAALIADNQ